MCLVTFFKKPEKPGDFGQFRCLRSFIDRHLRMEPGQFRSSAFEQVQGANSEERKHRQSDDSCNQRPRSLTFHVNPETEEKRTAGRRIRLIKCQTARGAIEQNGGSQARTRSLRGILDFESLVPMLSSDRCSAI
jgi:hypothetical protein